MSRSWTCMAFAGLVLLMTGCRGGAGDPPKAPLGVERVYPTRLPNDRETLLLIVGSGFREGMTATLGARTLQQTSFINEVLLSAVVPRGVAAGAYPLAVRAPGGSIVTSGEMVTVVDGRATATPTPTVVPAAPPPTPTSPPPTRTPTRAPEPTQTPAPQPTPTATPRPPTPAPTQPPMPAPQPTAPPPTQPPQMTPAPQATPPPMRTSTVPTAAPGNNGRQNGPNAAPPRARPEIPER